MIKPTRHDLVLYRGRTFKQPFTFFSDAAQTQAIDIGGGTVLESHMRDSWSPNGSLLADFSPTLVTDGSDGQMFLSSASLVTGSIAPAIGYYDVRLTSGGTLDTYIYGEVEVRDFPTT